MQQAPERGRIPVSFRLRVGNRVLEATVTLPVVPVEVAEMLPVFYAFADAYLAAVTAQVEEQGRKVSCRAGCGACCRQLVPVSEAEASRLVRLMATWPSERRRVVLERFQRTLKRLEQAGLLDRLRRTQDLRNVEDRRQIGMEYFALGLPCPFLEEQSCSIYPDRPMRCREYLVTSPAAHCADPRPETIEMVRLPVKFSEILYCFDDGRGLEATRWLALPLMLEWAERHAGEARAAVPAPEQFRNFLAQLAPPACR